MEFNRVTVDTQGTVGVVRFNHPEVLNAMGEEMLEGLWGALDYIEDGDNSFRCILLTGQGRAFCSGANLAPSGGKNPRGGKTPRASDAGKNLEVGYHPVLRRFRELKMPLVTAVNGAAAGIGMSFALMGDIILASQSAFFLQAFRRIGLVPDGGSTWLLPRLVGMARAKELSLLGERLGAEKALEWGLINRVVAPDALMEQAGNLAQDLAQGPTVALSLTREAFWKSLDNSYEAQLHLERSLQKISGRSQDSKEGIKAFLEKRPAEFKGC